MTFDPKPLLKGFGAVADVAGQIATDKAVNSRRTRSGFLQADITKGQFLEDVPVIDGTNEVPHDLPSTPRGAWVIKSGSPNATYNCVGTSAQSVQIESNAATTISLWVV